jgi:hypothetical protein
VSPDLIAAAFRSRLSANSPVSAGAISWEFFGGPPFTKPTVDLGSPTSGNWLRPSIAFAPSETVVYGGGSVFNDYSGAWVVQCFAWFGLAAGAASTLAETLANTVKDVFDHARFSGIECMATTFVYVAPEKDSKYQQVNVMTRFRATEARAA